MSREKQERWAKSRIEILNMVSTGHQKAFEVVPKTGGIICINGVMDCLIN